MPKSAEASGDCQLERIGTQKLNYVVFDLEWNQCPYGKEMEDLRLPFEIIEIGAVKINRQMEYIDGFQQLIKPRVYRTLHWRTREIVNITRHMLDTQGIGFQEAVENFLRWAGPDAVFCTWGTTDLTELQRNMRYYHILDLLPGPMHYLDVQKLFAVQYEDMKKRRALEYAIDFLHLDKDKTFHRAQADAWYTGKVLQTIEQYIIDAYDSIDVYQNPKTKTDEIHLVYNGYTKFISREFENKEDAMNDREVKALCCSKCGRSSRKKIFWFSVNSKNYYSVGVCPEHGLMQGRIRMRKTDDGKLYVVKTIRPCSETDVIDIRQKKEEMRLKHRRNRGA